jgi:hypothetical protein
MSEFPLNKPVTKLDISSNLQMPRITNPHNSGEFVAVRLVNEEHEGKTYFGIILGDMHACVDVRVSPDKDTAQISSFLNIPAIFVPELKQIIYGAECWWRLIATEDQLSSITDADLDRWSELVRDQIKRLAPELERHRAERDANKS